MALPKIILVTTDKTFAATAKAALGEAFALTMTSSGKKALAILAKDSRYMVIVSDMTVKDIDGRELLATAMDRHPRITRIMITKERDFDHAMQLVNTADISWLLPKPCEPEQLLEAVKDSVRRYKKEKAEAEAMKDTLFGSVRMLVDIMELTHPEAVHRSKRIRRRAQHLSKDLKAMSPQLMDMVTLLSNIGCVGLPTGLLKKMEKGKNITKSDMKRFRTHPSIAARLLENVPRMGKMAEIIRHQNTPACKKPPLGSRILKVCIDMDQMQLNGVNPDKILDYMREKPYIYDPKVVEAMTRHRDAGKKEMCAPIGLADLEPGMVMRKDMVTEKGAILLNKGEYLSEASYMRIQAFSDLLKIKEPLFATLPDSAS